MNAVEERLTTRALAPADISSDDLYQHFESIWRSGQFQADAFRQTSWSYAVLLAEAIAKRAKDNPPLEAIRQVFQDIIRQVRERTILQDTPVIPDVFRDGFTQIPTDLAMLGVMRAIHSAANGDGWDDQAGQTVPTYRMPTNKGGGAIYVSVRPPDGDETPPAGALAELWTQVRAMDDLTSDALLVCMAQWANRSDGPRTPVWVTADSVLDARNVRRIHRRGEPANWQHGHRREDRLEVGRAFAQLDQCWLKMANVRLTLPGRKRAQTVNFDSKALALLDKAGQTDFDGDQVFLAARVMPGEWATAYWDLGIRQTGLLAQKVLAYNPHKQRAEKRLGKYLSFLYRIGAKGRPETLRLKVRTLIENAGIELDTRNPQRTKTTLERALTTLKEDAVIADWGPTIDPRQVELPARGWLPVWLEWSIWIELPAFVQSHNARMHVTRQKAKALPPRTQLPPLTP